MKKKRVITSFTLDEALLARLDDAAHEEGRSRSQILREAVERYLESEPTTDIQNVTVRQNRRQILVTFQNRP